MKLVLFYSYLVSILISALLAIYYRKHLRDRQLLVMVPYLLLVFIQETFLGFARLLDFYTNNAIVYNFYRPINVLVFAYVYYQIPFMKPFRKLIIGITLSYLLITILDYLLFESIFITSTYLTLARGFIITFFAVLFLFKYFLLDNVDEEKKWHPLIWITIGVLIFYPVISISISLQKFLLAYHGTNRGFQLYNFIPQLMSIFMYGCFSYAFYLCQRKKLILSLQL